MTLRLQASDPLVLALTRKAMVTIASSTVTEASLRLRCSTCRNVLARAGYTPHGALFMSSWRVPGKARIVIQIDEEPAALTLRQQYRIEATLATEIADSGLPEDDHHSVFALLALPPEMAADYPDLLVRCERDGDLVLDRVDVLAWLRIGGDVTVDVGAGRFEYDPPDWSWLDGAANVTTQRVERVVRYGGPRPND